MKKVKNIYGLSKKIVSAALAIMTATVVLASCGNHSDNKTAESGTSDSTSSESTLNIQTQKAVDSPEWFKKLDAAKDCEQLIVVAGVGETTCYVSMHEKDPEGNWKMILQTPGYI